MIEIEGIEVEEHIKKKLIDYVVETITQQLRAEIFKQMAIFDVIVTWKLAHSMEDKKIEDGYWEIDINAPYAGIVEFGRGAGKPPPLKAIEIWLYHKFHITDKAERIALAKKIRKNIAEGGYAARPFTRSAIEELMKKYGSTVYLW